MKKFLSFILILTGISACSQAQENIKLLVRADDIGSSHNANLACIQSYREGIVRSVEIMVPGPWFEEAVKMLNENPDLDVGVHLVLTSEWENYKWRPLTGPSSITDANGYFYPMVWANENFPEDRTLQGSKSNLSDVEKELRAQIETAMKKIPAVSHLSNHMGWSSLSPELQALSQKLAKEYKLEVDNSVLKSTGAAYDKNSGKNDITGFIDMLNSLQPGTYLYVEHPGLDTPESRGIFHKGYENVAEERQAVTDLFTDPEVIKTIQDKNIKLISYKDLKK